MKLDVEDQLSWIIDQTLAIAEKVKQGDSSILYPNHIDQYSTLILAELDKLEPGADNNAITAIAEAKALVSESQYLFQPMCCITSKAISKNDSDPRSPITDH